MADTGRRGAGAAEGNRAGAAGALRALAPAPSRHERAQAAASMTALSSGFGYALTREAVVRRLLTLTPALAVAALAVAALAYGVWYPLTALSITPALR